MWLNVFDPMYNLPKVRGIFSVVEPEEHDNRREPFRLFV